MDNNEINLVTSSHSIVECILCLPPSTDIRFSGMSTTRARIPQRTIVSIIYAVIDVICGLCSTVVRRS